MEVRWFRWWKFLVRTIKLLLSSFHGIEGSSSVVSRFLNTSKVSPKPDRELKPRPPWDRIWSNLCLVVNEERWDTHMMFVSKLIKYQTVKICHYKDDTVSLVMLSPSSSQNWTRTSSPLTELQLSICADYCDVHLVHDLFWPSRLHGDSGAVLVRQCGSLSFNTKLHDVWL